jgi:hypothetical protein
MADEHRENITITACMNDIMVNISKEISIDALASAVVDFLDDD